MQSLGLADSGLPSLNRILVWTNAHINQEKSIRLDLICKLLRLRACSIATSSQMLQGHGEGEEGATRHTCHCYQGSHPTLQHADLVQWGWLEPQVSTYQNEIGVCIGNSKICKVADFETIRSLYDEHDSITSILAHRVVDGGLQQVRARKSFAQKKGCQVQFLVQWEVFCPPGALADPARKWIYSLQS